MPRDKSELLAAIADADAASIKLPTGPGSWHQQMSALLVQVRRIFERHPGGLRLGLADAPPTPAALEVSEAGLAILRRAGSEPSEAVSAWQSFLSYTAGFPGFRSPETGAQAARRALTTLAAIGDRYPALGALAPGIAASDPDEAGTRVTFAARDR